MNLLMYDVNKEQREKTSRENERRTVIMKKMISLILVLALALCMVPVFAEEEAADEEVSELALMTYAEYAEAEIDAPVYVETYVQATQYFNEEYGNTSIYAQSEDGAYFVYRLGCTKEEAEKLVPGTKIAVKGFKAMWPEVNGEVEITDATIEILEADPFIAEVEDVTEKVGTDELAESMNKRVVFKGLTVVAQEDGAAVNYKNNEEKTGDIYFTAAKDGKEVKFCVETDLCNEETDVYATVGALKVGDVIDVESFLYWYEGANPHVVSVTVAQ